MPSSGCFEASRSQLESPHVRRHLAWSVQDLLRSKRSARSAFARLARSKGPKGDRAAEAMAALEDQTAVPLAYKVELDTVREFFTPKKRPRSAAVCLSARISCTARPY